MSLKLIFKSGLAGLMCVFSSDCRSVDGKFIEMEVDVKWFSMLLPTSGSHQIFNRNWTSLET